MSSYFNNIRAFQNWPTKFSLPTFYWAAYTVKLYDTKPLSFLPLKRCDYVLQTERTYDVDTRYENQAAKKVYNVRLKSRLIS